MHKLNVTVAFPNGNRLFCGEIFTTEPDFRGRISGAFRYAKEYLEHPDAFPLDPAHLPLGTMEYDPERPEGVHGVFEDALPDDWGRKLLVKKWNIPRANQTIPALLGCIQGCGMGALSFSAPGEAVETDSDADLSELSKVLDAALKYDAGLPVDDEGLQALFSCGSSPGGARPKALIRNRTGRKWLAKFPKPNDMLHVEAIEAATLQLARNAGMVVPDFMLRAVGNREVLLVDRFDVTPQGGRNHMVSLQTLLGADGYYHLSYSDIFRVLNTFSCRPQADTDALFRQMVFNVIVGNTDDHLKNFSLVRTDMGFHLSPAYDLIPDIFNNREHQLSFPQGAGTIPPDRDMLIRIGQVQKVSDPQKIISDVWQSVSGWRDTFGQYGVASEDIARLEFDITRRLEKTAERR